MLRQLLIAALIGVAFSTPHKVDKALIAKYKTQKYATVVIEFNKDVQPVHDRINSFKFTNRGAKITEMKTQLEALAAETQVNVLAALSNHLGRVTSFWINNRVHAELMTLADVQKIAALDEVVHIREEIVVHLDEPIHEGPAINAEWGIEIIQAEQAWVLPGGNNGAGVVVSTIDTGVRYTHEAVRASFRAEYGWFDPYTSTANPIDQNGHGTHTMGTIVGTGGIGVAPGATWIACRGCSTSSCTENALNACGEWTACPTLPNGQSPDCSKAPALSSNSWGGGRGDNWYNPVVTAWHTAGIIPLFSQGNSGPSCSTANSPGDMSNVVGVGSTTSTDDISSFSSRGPAVDGSVKPDISAPGSNVRSSWYTSDTAYNTISGTSMACPHVAGNVALLLSSNPNFTYQQIKDLLQDNADRNLGSAATCGGTPPTQWPNNIYGYGRINALRSLTAAIGGK